MPELECWNWSMPQGASKKGRAGDGILSDATSSTVLGKRKRLAEGLERHREQGGLAVGELDVEAGVKKEVIMPYIVVQDSPQMNEGHSFRSLYTPRQATVQRHVGVGGDVIVNVPVRHELEKQAVVSQALGLDNAGVWAQDIKQLWPRSGPVPCLFCRGDI